MLLKDTKSNKKRSLRRDSLVSLGYLVPALLQAVLIDLTLLLTGEHALLYTQAQNGSSFLRGSNERDATNEVGRGVAVLIGGVHQSNSLVQQLQVSLTGLAVTSIPAAPGDASQHIVQDLSLLDATHLLEQSDGSGQSINTGNLVLSHSEILSFREKISFIPSTLCIYYNIKKYDLYSPFFVGSQVFSGPGILPKVKRENENSQFPHNFSTLECGSAVDQIVGY